MNLPNFQFTSSKRWYAVVTAAVLVLLIGGIFTGHSGRAQTVIPLSACTTISTSGSYQVVVDISKTEPTDRACFIIAANDVTLDGNNKTVNVYKPTDLPTGAYYPIFAVDVVDNGGTTYGWHNITIKNLTSNFGIRIIGDTINNITLDRLNVWEIANLGGDDVTITNNTVGAGGMLISNNGQSTWRPMRTVVRYNTVTGGIPDVSKLFEIMGSAEHPCPRLDAVVEYNNIVATHSAETYSGVPNDEATAARVRCATHTRFANNTIRSTGFARGLFLRDESDDGVYENNTVITNTDPALWIPSGNLDKTLPSRNTFHNNVFRTEAGYVFYAESMGSQNTFTDNVFYANVPARLSPSGGDHGNLFDHNTFYNSATGGSTLLLVGENVVGPPVDTYTNNIFSYSGSAVFSYEKWSPSLYDGDYNLFHNRGGALSFGNFGNSLAAWRTTTGDDANSINADPLLTNPAGGDFTLQLGSPAINAASDGTDIGARQAAVLCSEYWTCGAWSACNNNSQTRTCTDANLCGTTTDRPALTQTCSCTESWTCGEWSSCVSGAQTRTCSDGNSCGTTANRPALTQACAELPMPDTTPPAAVGDLTAK